MPGESRIEAVLDLRAVSKRFGSHAAVSDVSLTIRRGSFYGLLGPSGCGKTTTLRLIAGFEQPDAGEILLNGRDIARLRPYQRPVSTVFQNYALFPHLTARGNIAWGQCKGYGLQSGHFLLEAAEIADIKSRSGVHCDHQQTLTSSVIARP